MSLLQAASASYLGGWYAPDASTDVEKELPIPEIAPANAIHHRMLGPFEAAITPRSGSHVVHQLSILEGKDKGKRVFYKKCDIYYPPKLAQIEAATSASYRIVLGERAALIRPVVDDKGDVIGTISYAIPNFKPMSIGIFSAQKLLKMGAAASLVARYVREEDDYHPDNMGFTDYSGTVEIAEIDFDMSWYPLTSLIKGARLINGIVTPLPHKAFLITDRDDDDFPVLTDAQGCYWPAYSPKNGNILRQDNNISSYLQLKTDKDFHLKKNYAFLLEVLIPPKTHSRIMGLSYSKKSEDKDAFLQVAEHVRERYLELERNKINKSSFRKFIVKYNDSILKSLEHFAKYNEKISTHGVVFDLEEIKNRYDILLKKCLFKDLTQVLMNIRMSFNNIYNTSESFTKCFNDVVNICIGFEEMNDSLANSFMSFKQEIMQYMENVDHRVKAGWIRQMVEFSRVIENYQGTLFDNPIALEHSVFMPKPKRAISFTKGQEVEPEITVARALKNWLIDPQNINRIIEIVKDSLHAYKPVEFFNFAPMSLFRDRKSDFDKLIKDLEAIKAEFFEEIPRGIIARHVVKFTKDGAWNEDGYFRSGSANVLLIDQLSCATLDDFKNHLSLRQLKQQDLINVFIIIQSGKTKLQHLTKKIAEQLDLMLK